MEKDGQLLELMTKLADMERQVSELVKLYHGKPGQTSALKSLFDARTLEAATLRTTLSNVIDQILELEKRITTFTHLREKAENSIREEIITLSAEIERSRRENYKLEGEIKETNLTLMEKDRQLSEYWNRIQSMRISNRLKRLFPFWKSYKQKPV